MTATDDLLARADHYAFGEKADLIRDLAAALRTTETQRTIGPCGDQAEVPQVTVRRVDTADGPKVEIAMTSAAYCWRVRSWWTPEAATEIAEAIAHATRSEP